MVVKVFNLGIALVYILFVSQGNALGEISQGAANFTVSQGNAVFHSSPKALRIS